MIEKGEFIEEADKIRNELVEKGGEIIQEQVEKYRKKRWERLVSIRSMYIGALFFALLAGVLSYSGVLDEADMWVSDSIHQYLNRKRTVSAIKIIAIDEKSEKYFGKYSDWSRRRMAALVRKLNRREEEAPKAIGIDLDYSSEKDKEGDDSFAEICSKYDNICIGAPIISERKKNDRKKSASLYEIEGEDIKMPYDALREQVKIGISNNIIDSDDGYARRTVAGSMVGDTKVDSFAVVLYMMYRDSQGMEYTLPNVDDEQTFSFTYTSQSEDYSVYSFYDVMSGAVDADVFRDGIVLVGDYTNEDMTFKVPNQRDAQMQEIEVQANILEALLQQRTGRPVPKIFMAIFYAIFIGLFFIATSYSSGSLMVLITLLLNIIQLAICVWINRIGYYVTVLIPMILVVVVVIVNLFLRYLIALQNSWAVESVFKKYVDKSVVEELTKNGIVKAQVGVVRKDIAVMFVDIRGYTSLSESLLPEQIVEILNAYLELVAKAVLKYQGTIDKFIGDAAMAVFNSPLDLEDYEFRAVCAAWELLSNAKDLNQICREKFGREVAFGIGIQCGEAVIGNIGSELRMDYTAIGDTVNTASRLEGVAAPGQILISEEMKERLGDKIASSFAGAFELKGKQNKVPTYSVEGVLASGIADKTMME